MELNIVDFRYTKENNEKSDRKVLVLSKPSDLYFGIEVGYDLTPVREYLQYMDELKACELELKAKYKVASMELPYKSFKKEKISRLLEETINVDVDKL